MALETSSNGEFMTVRNPYNLQTQQKRLRHLRSISIRNLHSGGQGHEHISRLQCYFTLHADVTSQAFYQSEKITGSTNPSWQSFDISQFEDQIDLASKFFVVRVWVGQQLNFSLLIMMEVHLTGLHFLTDKLQQLLLKYNPNTVIFGLLDKEFIYINREQSRIKNLVKKVSDLDLPSSRLPAVVKVEKGTVRNSYTTSSLSRIQTVLRAIKQMQTHARRYRRQIEDRLLASQENSQRFEAREHLHMSVGQLRRELLRRTTHLHQSQERLQAVMEAAKSKVETLQDDSKAAKNEKHQLQEDKREYIMKREQLVKENALLSVRRRQMLSELFNYIYPITEDDNKYFINNVRLPHAEEFQGQDETMIAVGLGYSCHFTIKISQILGLPLRHPMENRGSKSVIYDQVHSKLADKDREFPLYSKGKDKYHFNYGVFLLNKNVSQIRFQCSLPTLDLRVTLKNLLTLMHKLGVRMEGDTTLTQAFTSTSDGTARSRTSPNGSSAGTNQTPSFLLSANGDVNKTQVSKSGHHHSKTSDFSEEGSTVASIMDNPSSRSKEEDETRHLFDESEDIFKPAGDDHFFKVNNSLINEFNSLSLDSSRHCGADSLLSAGSTSGIEDSEKSSLMSVIIQAVSDGETLTPKSFQLIKQSKARVDDDGSQSEYDSDNNSRTGNEVDNNGMIDCTDKISNTDENEHIDDQADSPGAVGRDGSVGCDLADASWDDDGLLNLNSSGMYSGQSGDHHSTPNGSSYSDTGYSGPPTRGFDESSKDSFSDTSVCQGQNTNHHNNLERHFNSVTDAETLLLKEDEQM